MRIVFPSSVKTGSHPHSLVVSSCHEVIPGGTKATIVGVDEEGDLPVFTDDGKTMATWCSIWLQVWERQCGPLDHASQPVQHCNCRNRMFKQHRTTLGVCCCRSVGYFVGALAEVLRSEFFIFFFRCSIHVMFVYICSHTRISSTIVKRNAGKSQLDSVLNRFCPTMADHCTCNSHFPPLCMYGFHPAARLDSL